MWILHSCCSAILDSSPCHFDCRASFSSKSLNTLRSTVGQRGLWTGNIVRSELNEQRTCRADCRGLYAAKLSLTECSSSSEENVNNHCVAYKRNTVCDLNAVCKNCAAHFVCLWPAAALEVILFISMFSALLMLYSALCSIRSVRLFRLCCFIMFVPPSKALL